MSASQPSAPVSGAVGPELYDLTARFADQMTQMASALPGAVAHEARRCLLNVLGTAIGASHNRVVDAVVRAAGDAGSKPEIAPPGRRDSIDRYSAATAIGTAAHVDDFDDTHLSTVIHPGAATLAVVYPLDLLAPRPGKDSLSAFAIGVESQLRVGQAMSPWHYDDGWHITGTAGVIGAAVAASHCLGLDVDALRSAIGIAASETLGLREAFGSAVKGFHPGKAASNGMLAAQLAAVGFSASDRVLEAPRGYFHVLSPSLDLAPMLTERWLILENTYKPFPCGIVAHPAIDAALRLHARLGANGAHALSSVTVRCNPLVVDLMGKTSPTTGLEARFSAMHAVGVALATGRAGLVEFSDEVVRSAEVTAVRDRVSLIADESVGRASATIEVRLANGEVLSETVDVAIGSLERPMSDSDIEEKFKALVEPVLPARAEALIEAVWQLGDTTSITDIATAAGSPSHLTTLPPRVAMTGDVAGDQAFDPSSITGQLATFASTLTLETLPDDARHNARRTLANALGLAVGASDADAVLLARTVALGVAVEPRAHVLGSGTMLGATWAALINGIAIHVEDFDDTHLATVVHPGAPIVAAALAMAELVDASGADLLAGIAAGVEVALRIGLGLGSAHFDRGWHLTGTAGHVGAAVAAGRVGRLSTTQMVAAIGAGATEAAGLQEALGTMTKSFHAGKAAMDGVEAALLARAGFDGPAEPIEGRRGLLAVASTKPDPDAVVSELGTRFELAENAFKPYACGIVSHPVIDAAIALRAEIADPDGIDAVTVRVHPVVLDVMGVRDPSDALASKFSYTHCFAVGIIDGAAGPAQYDDAHATDPSIARLRAKIQAELDPTLDKDACIATIRIGDRTLVHRVEHATGSASTPMTDEQLLAKAHLVGDRVIGAERVARLFELSMTIEDLEHASELIEACVAKAP